MFRLGHVRGAVQFMGVASYREDLLTRYYEGRPAAVPPPATVRYRCPFCNESFETKGELNAHRSSAHRGERPILLIKGREPATNETIRQALRPDDIEAVNCTSVRIRRNGVAMPPDSVPNILCDRIACEKDALLECELVNEFDPAAVPVVQPYRLTLSIPGKQALDAVDRAFREILARDAPDMSDVERFLDRDCTKNVPARDYADALASYVRGVSVKDGTGGATLPPGEAANLYGKAHETLRDFHRPLPRVICGLVRLESNDFSLAGEVTGFRRLDNCNAALGPAAGVAVSELNKDGGGEPPSGRMVMLCPIDRTLDRILDLAAPDRMRCATLENCRQEAGRPGLTPNDRAKIHALHALAALQSNAAAEAGEPLRRLRNTYPFDDWAARELDRLDG